MSREHSAHPIEIVVHFMEAIKTASVWSKAGLGFLSFSLVSNILVGDWGDAFDLLVFILLWIVIEGQSHLLNEVMADNKRLRSEQRRY